MDEHTKNYIQGQFAAGKTKDQVIAELTAHGWQADQAVSVVGMITAPQTAAIAPPTPAASQQQAAQPLPAGAAQTQQPAPQVTTKQPRTGWKKWVLGDNMVKPPIVAQVLYAINFILLIIGLYSVVDLILTHGESSITASSNTLFFGVNFSVIPYLLAVDIILFFYLAHEIRMGKYWGLVAYTTLIYSATIDVIFKLITGSQLGSRFGIIDLEFVVLTGLTTWLLVKERSYFK